MFRSWTRFDHQVVVWQFYLLLHQLSLGGHQPAEVGHLPSQLCQTWLCALGSCRARTIVCHAARVLVLSSPQALWRTPTAIQHLHRAQELLVGYPTSTKVEASKEFDTNCCHKKVRNA